MESFTIKKEVRASIERGWWLIVLAVAAPAQTPLAVTEAVREALSAHPLLAAAGGRISVAEGMRRQAALGPNPRLVLQSENVRPYGPFRFWNDTDDFAYLQQTFETAGKRQRRVELADVDLRATRLRLELLRSQISGRVQQAYWIAAGASEVHKLLMASGANFQRIVEYHEIRVRLGAMAEADLLRVRLEKERLAVAANAAQLEAERARILLFQEMGRAEFPEVSFADPLEAPAPLETPAQPAAADVSTALRQRVEMQLARLAVEQAQAGLRLHQSAARPNLEVLFGYKRTAGFDTMVGGVQFDLPLGNRNQGGLAAAAADIRRAEADLAATQALVRAEVSAAIADERMRRRQIADALRPMRQQAAESSRISQAAYQEGGADLLRLLDAERIRIETDVQYVRSLAEYRQSLAALASALGVAP